MPRVTVLMPVYNGEKYLREAIDSVLSQKYTDYELLIIDDGSTDGSLGIIKSFDDPRIRLIQNNRNMGLAATRNKGLANARGEYIAWLDCDDIACPERLVEQVVFLDHNPAFGMIGSWIEMIDEKSRRTGEVMKFTAATEEIPGLLLFNNYFAQSALLIRKSVLPNAGYDEKCKVAEDYDLWVKMARKAKVWNLQKVLTKYRIHANSISFKESMVMEQCVRGIISSQLGQMIEPSSEELEIHRNIGTLHFAVSTCIIEKMELWLQKLYHTNKSVQHYPSPYFENVLAEKWFNVCSTSTELGWPVWRIYRRSFLFTVSDADHFQKVKLWIKCLVKWQN